MDEGEEGAVVVGHHQVDGVFGLKGTIKPTKALMVVLGQDSQLLLQKSLHNSILTCPLPSPNANSLDFTKAFTATTVLSRVLTAEYTVAVPPCPNRRMGLNFLWKSFCIMAHFSSAIPKYSRLLLSSPRTTKARRSRGVLEWPT